MCSRESARLGDPLGVRKALIFIRNFLTLSGVARMLGVSPTGMKRQGGPKEMAKSSPQPF